MLSPTQATCVGARGAPKASDGSNERLVRTLESERSRRPKPGRRRLLRAIPRKLAEGAGIVRQIHAAAANQRGAREPPLLSKAQGTVRAGRRQPLDVVGSPSMS